MSEGPYYFEGDESFPQGEQRRWRIISEVARRARETQQSSARPDYIATVYALDDARRITDLLNVGAVPAAMLGILTPQMCDDFTHAERMMLEWAEVAKRLQLTAPPATEPRGKKRMRANGNCQLSHEPGEGQPWSPRHGFVYGVEIRFATEDHCMFCGDVIARPSRFVTAPPASEPSE